MKKLEIACSNYESCVHAYRGGADRIELFENLAQGGCTPSYGMIKKVKENIPLPIYVMIRPHGGAFNYSKEEFEIMKHDVIMCKELKVDGIVFGILTDEKSVDVMRCTDILNLWGKQSATFHRAIDFSNDILESARIISSLGFERILSSGSKSKALDGIDILRKLKNEFTTLSIMPGSGINSNNIECFLEFDEIHATCKSVKYQNEMGEYIVSSEEEIKKISRWKTE